MTIDNNGEVVFKKSVTFTGDSVVQNIQTAIIQDQQLDLGLSNSLENLSVK